MTIKVKGATIVSFDAEYTERELAERLDVSVEEVRRAPEAHAEVLFREDVRELLFEEELPGGLLDGEPQFDPVDLFEVEVGR